MRGNNSKKNLLYNFVFLFIVIFPGQGVAQSDFVPVKGMTIGENYVVFEAEATQSPLGKWQIITPEDSRYKDKVALPPINETHLEFTGNNHNSGPATSPLKYKFVCPKTGKYRLGARLYQRLEGQAADKCNDVYIRMEGDFTSGNSVALTDLQHDQKFYGRGVNEWGALFSLEVHSTGNHAAALYNLKEGELYTLTVSGRSQRANIDYWILYETTINYTLQAHTDIATANPEKYRPLIAQCKTFSALDMKYSGIDGFTDAQTDSVAGLDILHIPDRGARAAAQIIYDGTDGEASFTLNTMQEQSGESTYLLNINGELIGEATNDSIYGTTIEDYTIQSLVMNEAEVPLMDGDTVLIAFNNTTNGLVPEGDTSATSNGRWVSLEICTTGTFKVYGLSFSEDAYSLQPGDSLPLDIAVSLPRDADTTLTWISENPEVATVVDGLISAVGIGHTKIWAIASDSSYSADCDVIVFKPLPFFGEAIAIPGLIEAEDFNIGTDGVTYHDTDAANLGEAYRPEEGVDIEKCIEGGYNVAWTKVGEWLTCFINVAETGSYYLETRVASPYKGNKFHVEIDDVDVTGTQIFSTTSSALKYVTVLTPDIDLTEGEHTLKFVFETGGINLNWMRMYTTGTPFLAESVEITPINFYLDAGQTRTIEATVLPEHASDKTVSWSSNAEEVATIDQEGNVTAIDMGVATFTATTNDGGFKATCNVRVYEATSVGEISNSVKIFPNPFDEELIIQMDVNFQVQEVRLLNLKGQVIYIKKSEGNMLKLTPSKEEVPGGLYIIELLGNQEVKRSLVQRL